MANVLLLADMYETGQNNASVPLGLQEWESEKSIVYLKQCIAKLGYQVEVLEPFTDKKTLLECLLQYLPLKQETILFNLVEGFASPNRRAWVPALAEFLGFAYTGSNAALQISTLDKQSTSKLVGQLGIPIPKSYLLQERYSLSQVPQSAYPLFVKPNREGSGMGVDAASIVEGASTLQKKIVQTPKDYFPLLLEALLPGKEYTVGILGNPGSYQVTKVAHVTYPGSVYGEEVKSKTEMPERLWFVLEASQQQLIQHYALRLANRLQLTGYARLDFKDDAEGRPHFLEVNLTPGFSRYYSSFPICYEASFSGGYSEMLAIILRLAMENYRKRPSAYGIR
ncbi:MAG: D-alanine--D-alanine ligase [Spirochaetota bacterium]